MTTHIIPRHLVPHGGFDSPDRSGGYVKRVTVPYEQDVRLIVEGVTTRAGFGLTAVDGDQWYNLGPGLGTAKGPHVGAYGHAGVIDNYGSIRRELDEARRDGRLIHAQIGDRIELDGLEYRIDFYRRGGWVDKHNIELHLVDTAE